MRSIAVVTTSRADYGIFLPILRRIRTDARLSLALLVGGAHLSPQFGLTVRDIESDGFEIGARVELLLSSDSAEGIAKSLGLAVIGFAQAYAHRRPDVIVLLGDRWEILAAAAAALPMNIPIAHIHGGEVTEGVIDERARHAITKLSHVHFAATEEYARRLVQMGEEPWRVTVSGAPSLDNLRAVELLDRAALAAKHGLELDGPFLLVTYHPVTIGHERIDERVATLLRALERSRHRVVFSYPGADAHAHRVIERIEDFARRDARVSVVKSLGTQGYWSLMAQAAAMVGNSSSGIIEAASLGLPVVNVGDRQRGRIRARNVIDVADEDEPAIVDAIARASSPAFRAGLAGLANPYGDGHAAERIVERLAELDLARSDLVAKRFHDLPRGANDAR